jgi:predicted esterase
MSAVCLRAVPGALAWVSALALAAACAGPASAASDPPADPEPGLILPHVPEHPDTSAFYLFYLHGKIVEDQGEAARSPEFGPYEYSEITAEFAARGFTVVSEMRPRGTDVDEYAAGLVREVRALLAAGVPPDHVTVAGHSKGGAIALRVSALLANDEVRFAILAGCAEWSFRGMPGPLHGHILSIYDRSDTVAGTCQPLFDKMPEGSVTHETVLDTGGGHGVFFRPERVWLEQVDAWAKGRVHEAPAPPVSGSHPPETGH